MSNSKKSKRIAEPPLMDSTMNWRLLGILLGLLAVISIIRLAFPELGHGDEWSDSSVMIAGENFDRLGFGPSHGLPIFYPQALTPPPSIRPDSADWNELSVFGTYTRLPPLFHWINGSLQPVFGYESLSPYRCVTVLASWVAVLSFFGLVQILFRSARFSFFCAVIYISNPYFIANFDSLHQHAYMDCFRNLALFALAWLALKDGCQLGRSWILCWLALFFLSITTYEYLPWMTLAVLGVAGFQVYCKNWRGAAIVTLLGTGIAAGLVLHFGLVSWHYASIREAFADRLANATQRVLGNENLLGSMGGLDWGVWLEVVALKFPAQVSVVGWGWLMVFIGLGIALPLFLSGQSKKTLLLAFGLGLFFILCAFSWYALMPAHCIDHSGLSFLQKFLIPGMCIILAVPIEAAFRILETKGVPVLPRSLLCYAPLAVIATLGILQSELPVTPQKIAYEEEFLKVADCLRKIRPLATPQDFLACNLMRPTWMMMYYTKTRAVGVSTVEEFEKLKEKPKFFLLVPINNPETQRLAQRLEKSYRIRSVCDNKRLPFYVMEKI
jgi:hypothetical protein